MCCFPKGWSAENARNGLDPVAFFALGGPGREPDVARTVGVLLDPFFQTSHPREFPAGLELRTHLGVMERDGPEAVDRYILGGMRGIATGRMIYMFVGLERGGKSTAIIYNLI